MSFLRRPYDPYAPKNLWDFWIWICFFSFIWWTYRINLYGTWQEKNFLGKEYRAKVLASNWTLGFYEQEIWLLIACSVSMWVRVFYMLRYN